MSRWTDEQLKAINIEGKNVIVSAGAGSGKTAVLTERVLRKLKEGVNINELLILTFTSAAANEMKDRIRKKIIKEGLSEQIELLDEAYITTFDSYALNIVKKYNYVLNIPKDVSIVDPSIIEIKKSEIVDNILEEYYGQNNTLFNNLIDGFCVKDDTVIKDGILNLYKKISMKNNYIEYLDNYIDNYYNDKFIDINIEKYIYLLKEKIIEIKEYVKIISNEEDMKYVDKLYKVVNPLLESETYNEIKENSILTLPSLSKESSVYEYKNILNEKIKELNKLCIYEREENIKESIISTKENVKIIIELLKNFDKELMKYKSGNNLYEFSDIALMAIKVINDNKSIKEEIRNSFNEILLDEYQDTNDLQEEFIKLIEKNNVYCVGDIKQSIYRFRNANPKLFKDKYDNYKNSLAGEKIDLNKNFRSRFEPLDNINDIFNIIMTDEIGGANYRLEHQMVFGNRTYIEEGKTEQDYNIEIKEYETDEYKKEEIEAFIIANDIKNKVENKYKVFDKDRLELRNIEYKDFVILMDRKKDFDLYKKIFEYLDIPLTLNKEENINSGYDLDIIKNAINIIIKLNKKEYDNSFKHSFLSLERSFLIEEDDNKIFEYISNNNYENSKIVEILNDIKYKTHSIKSLIEVIIDRLDYYNNLIKVGNIEESLIRIQYILNLSDSLNNYYSIEDFLNYLNTVEKNKMDIKYNINMESENSVSIMTIFKSKGLEFNICYFPGLYNEFNKQEFLEKFIFSNSLGIIIPYIKNSINDTFYKILYKEKYKKEEISEKIRLFYVALTRAKEKIIIVKPKVGKNVNNILECKSFLDMINYSDLFENNKELITLDNIQISRDYKKEVYKSLDEALKPTDVKINVKYLNILSNEKETTKFSKESGLINNDIKNKMKFGIKIHEELENLNFNNPKLGLIEDKFIRNKISNFIKLDIFKNIKNYYQEYEFMYETNDIKHGIIDLLLEYEDHYKIIDYKLKNIDDEKYIKQLMGYKDFIEKITNKKTEVYLYSFINEELKKIN